MLAGTLTQSLGAASASTNAAHLEELEIIINKGKISITELNPRGVIYFNNPGLSNRNATIDTKYENQGFIFAHSSDLKVKAEQPSCQALREGLICYKKAYKDFENQGFGIVFSLKTIRKLAIETACCCLPCWKSTYQKIVEATCTKSEKTLVLLFGDPEEHWAYDPTPTAK